MKRFLPKSLYGRAVAIVILPILVMQLLVTYIFFNAHWDNVTARMSEAVAGEVALAVDLYREDPSAATAQKLDAQFLESSELSLALERGDTLPAADRPNLFSNLDRTLRDALVQRLDDPYWFDTTRYPNHIDIRVAVNEGVLRFIAARERVFAPTGYGFVLLLVATTLGLTLVSIILLRGLAGPMIELARAADAFGRGQERAFKPTGAAEVRMAGQSFLKMRKRIERFVDQRTNMLAGVSHDLRTPLQRLKLHLALADDTEENREARRDLAEMEAMLDGYLDFAKSDTVESTEPMRLSELVRGVAEAHGVDDIHLHADGEVDIRPVAFRRALANLVSNAVKYAPAQRITLSREDEEFRIVVEDDGPGITEDMRAEAMRPFSRLQEGRNQNVEGTGLGLAIARDIARTHGGTVSLGDSELGGLKAELRIPA